MENIKFTESQKEDFSTHNYQQEFEFADNPKDFTILPHERLNLEKEDELLEAVCHSFGADMKLIRELHDVEYSYVGKKARNGILKTIDQIIEVYLKNQV